MEVRICRAESVTTLHGLYIHNLTTRRSKHARKDWHLPTAFAPYGGWKKSCTTLVETCWNPINNGINHLSTGAGFRNHPQKSVWRITQSIDSGTTELIWILDDCPTWRNHHNLLRSSTWDNLWSSPASDLWHILKPRFNQDHPSVSQYVTSTAGFWGPQPSIMHPLAVNDLKSQLIFTHQNGQKESRKVGICWDAVRIWAPNLQVKTRLPSTSESLQGPTKGLRKAPCTTWETPRPGYMQSFWLRRRCHQWSTCRCCLAGNHACHG